MGTFGEECDRLMLIADPTGFERDEWARTGGKVLDNAVSLTQSAFGNRSEFEVTEVEGEAHRRYLVLSAAASRGGVKIAMINFAVSSGMPVIWASDLPNSGFHVTNSEKHHPATKVFDGVWIEAALAQILGSIEKSSKSTTVLLDDDDD